MTTEGPATISAKNGHNRCLLCGHLNPRSLNLIFRDGENGVVETRFKAGPELQGYDNILHGGVIASLLDAAMTHCLFHRGIQAVTGDLHVRFVRPIPCNTSLEIRARMTSCRPPLYMLEAQIEHDQRVAARAEAKFMKRGFLDGTRPC